MSSVVTVSTSACIRWRRGSCASSSSSCASAGTIQSSGRRIISKVPSSTLMTTTPTALWPATFALVTLSLSLVLFVYERTLVPLYGSGPTNYLLSAVLHGTMLAAAIQPFHVSRRRNLLYAAIAFSIAPRGTYWVGVMTSRRGQPVLGPAVTHAAVLGPLTFILTTFLMDAGRFVSPSTFVTS